MFGYELQRAVLRRWTVPLGFFSGSQGGRLFLVQIALPCVGAPFPILEVHSDRDHHDQASDDDEHRDVVFNDEAEHSDGGEKAADLDADRVAPRFVPLSLLLMVFEFVHRRLHDHGGRNVELHTPRAASRASSSSRT